MKIVEEKIFHPRKKKLDKSKEELRKLYGKEEK
jgi:hypothetical protein